MQLREWHGTGAQALTVQFGSTDQAAAAALILPGVPDTSNYSYQKFLRLYIENAPRYVTNLACWASGSDPTGVNVWAGTAASDAAHIIPQSDVSPPLLNGSPMVDFSTYTASNKLPLDSGAGIYTAGDCGLFLVLVCSAGPNGVAGNYAGETVNFSWNEA